MMGLKQTLRRSRRVDVQIGDDRIGLDALPASGSDFELFQLSIEDGTFGPRQCAEILASSVSAVYVGAESDADYPSEYDDREEFWLEACDAKALMQLTSAVFTGGEQTAGKSEP